MATAGYRSSLRGQQQQQQWPVDDVSNSIFISGRSGSKVAGVDDGPTTGLFLSLALCVRSFTMLPVSLSRARAHELT